MQKNVTRVVSATAMLLCALCAALVEAESGGGVSTLPASEPSLPSDTLASVASMIRTGKYAEARQKVQELNAKNPAEVRPFEPEEVQVLEALATICDHSSSATDRTRLDRQMTDSMFKTGVDSVSSLYAPLVHLLAGANRAPTTPPNAVGDASIRELLLSGNGWVAIDVSALRAVLGAPDGALRVTLTKATDPGRGLKRNVVILDPTGTRKVSFWAGRITLAAWVDNGREAAPTKVAEAEATLKGWSSDAVKPAFAIPQVKPKLQLLYDPKTGMLTWNEPEELRQNRHHLQLALLDGNLILRMMDITTETKVSLVTLASQRSASSEEIKLGLKPYTVLLLPVNDKGNAVGPGSEVVIEPNK